ncbi:MAG: hypothetical protein ACKVX9_08990 [Blastocatellia bacterium]
MSLNVTQESCVSGKFKRMNYFHGMLLTEQDFRDEQAYLREKLKLHNQLHGDGVVWGLRLMKDCFKIGSETITKIFIEGGLALDCAGNEIVVCEDHLVPLDEKVDELRKRGLLTKMEECRPPIYKGPKLFIGIKYCECKSMPAEQYTSECADDKLRPQFSRVREGFEVRLFTLEELPGCAKHKGAMPATGCSQSCPECHGLHACTEDEQIILLGCVEDYSTSIEKPDHADAIITHCENHPPTPSYLRMSMWASRRWEAQKQNALRTVLREAKWIDVSILLGEGIQGIGDRLKKMGLNLGETYTPGSIKNPQAFLEKAKCAQPWAAPGSKIDIVTDDGNGCITFLLVNPPA